VIGNLFTSDENLLVGIGSSDDASVYKIDDEKALVQTVDYITPVVDDPYVYGQIAAANSLSDIFAMGADVITAMNLVGFDGCNHPKEVLGEILQGGLSKVKECGGIIVGGHTIETPEMTYGLSVSGFVHPKKIFRNNTPNIGDVLILIIPAGTYANKDYVSLHVEVSKKYDDEIFFYDAQTSGGLLISINQKEAPFLLQRLKDEGYEYSTIVANVKEFDKKSIKLV